MIGKMRTLMAYIGIPLVIGDMRDTIVYVNSASSKTFGKSAPELVGKKLVSIFSSKNSEKVAAALVKVKKGEHQNIDMDENDRYLTGTLSPIVGDDGRSVGFILGLVDLSREKKLEQSKMDSQARIVNDIREPLKAIHEDLHRLLSIPDTSSREYKMLLDHAHLQLESAVKKLDEILGIVSEAETPLEVKKEPFDINRTLRMLIESLSPVLEKTTSRIEVLLPRELPPAMGDREKISQAFINLLSYAARVAGSAGDGGDVVTISGKAIKQKDGREQILIACSSQGFADGKEELELKNVRKIVEAHGGSFSVIGEKGLGTTFTVILPAEPQYH